jgi:hypothetical protein
VIIGFDGLEEDPNMSKDELPFTWKKSLLAIFPGVLVTLGWIRDDFSVWMLTGVVLLAAFLVLAYLQHKHQLPAWSLMAAGMFVSVCLTMAAGVVGGAAAMLVGGSANAVVLLLLLALLAVLLGTSPEGRHISGWAWIALGVIVLLQLAVRLKYFVLLGVSWGVAGQWLKISLYAAVIALLLPSALGYHLAKKHGVQAILFTIGMIYMGFQLLIDLNQKVSSQVGGGPVFLMYKTMIPLLFTIFAPLWFLRARSARSRVRGVLALTGLAVLINLVVVGLSYGGDLPLIIWISFFPYTLSVLLTLLFSYQLYQGYKKISYLL